MRNLAYYEDSVKERKGICLAVMLRILAATSALSDSAGDFPYDPPII
jgi:hypothetical protein